MFLESVLQFVWRLTLGAWFRTSHVLSSVDEKQALLDSSADDELTFGNEWPNDLGFDIVREERTPIDLPATGHIPLYAAGTIFRNGPGARQLLDEQGKVKYSVSHWFDGFAQLHKFELVPGSNGIENVRYSSRFAVDSLMQDLAKTGSFDGYTFAQKRDPCMSVFRKAMCLFKPVPEPSSSGTNVAVTISASGVGFPESALPLPSVAAGHHASKVPHLIARTDTTEMKALDPETLEPIGIAKQDSLHPLLKGPLSATHAKSDPETGDVFNYNLDLGKDATYRVFKTSAQSGETEILATIAAPDLAGAYMHSFLMSENYIVLCVWSAHLAAKGLKVLWEKNVLDAIAPFDESKTTRWFVIDRRHNRGVVAQFNSPAAFCFHTINAYEETQPDGGVRIICHLIEYGNLDILHAFYYENLRSSSAKAAPWARKGHRYARYRLDLPPTTQFPSLSIKQREQPCSLPASQFVTLLSTTAASIGDMPNINPRYLCKPHRYFWNGTVSHSHSFFDGLAKIDIQTGLATTWNNPVGHTPGEALFIPNPEGTEEDDGILLTIVLDGFEGTSYLLCLDARTMQEIGRADCKGPLPFMFHGQHVRTSGERAVDV